MLLSPNGESAATSLDCDWDGDSLLSKGEFSPGGFVVIVICLNGVCSQRLITLELVVITCK